MKNLGVLSLVALLAFAPAAHAQNHAIGITVSASPALVYAYEANAYLEIQAGTGLSFSKVEGRDSELSTNVGGGLVVTLPRSSGFQFRLIGVGAFLVVSAAGGTSVGVTIPVPFLGLGFRSGNYELIAAPQFDYSYLGGHIFNMRLVTGQVRYRF